MEESGITYLGGSMTWTAGTLQQNRRSTSKMKQCGFAHCAKMLAGRTGGNSLTLHTARRSWCIKSMLSTHTTKGPRNSQAPLTMDFELSSILYEDAR